VDAVRYEQVDPALPEPLELGRVGEAAVDRRGVELEVAGVDDEPVRVSIAKPSESGMLWQTLNGSTLKTPALMTSSLSGSARSAWGCGR
jgi:hypothetical protein